MHEDVLEEQRDLIEQVQDAGWEVTESELSVYESPWEDAGEPEATVTITARKVFPEAEDGEDNPFRVR